MELPERFAIYLMTPPQQFSKAQQYGLTPAHMTYRIGGGPHLFRTQGPVAARGGIMVADHQGYDGHGNPDTLCQEIVRECAARGFSGVFFDFEGTPLPLLRRVVEHLAPIFQKRRWSLYVPESYACNSPAVKIVIPTALSGGSLKQRLSQAVQSYGADRVVLGLEWVAEDFTLPAMSGSGRHLDWEELDRLRRQRSPAVYFSDELCAHYFTYMHTGQSAHFALFDDPSSMAKKLYVASALGICEAFLPDPQREDFLQELLSPGP